MGNVRITKSFAKNASARPFSAFTLRGARDQWSRRSRVPSLIFEPESARATAIKPDVAVLVENAAGASLLPAPAGGESDISKPYFEKFGNLPAGSRVFIPTRQQVDGWRDSFPAQFTVVVPGKPDPATKRRRRPATGVV